MRNVEAFSVLHESPARSVDYSVPMRRGCRTRAAWMPRPCRVDAAPVSRGCRRRVSAGFRPDAVKPAFHGVKTRWIRGFMAFQRARNTRIMLLMVPV